MIFKKINDNTINCIITEEDMRSHGLRLDDLFEKKTEAMEFLHTILEEAARKVNYHPQGGFTSMQMTVLGDNSVSLTITERTGAQFDEMLRRIQEKLGIKMTENFRKELAKLGDDDARIRRLKEYAARMAMGGEKEEKLPAAAPALQDNAASEKKAPEKDSIYMMEFPSFREVVSCAMHIANKAGENLPYSALYRMTEGEERYCLMLVRNPGMQRSTFSKIVLSLNEFAGAVTAMTQAAAHVMEHGEEILEENAIQVLCGLGENHE